MDGYPYENSFSSYPQTPSGPTTGSWSSDAFGSSPGAAHTAPIGIRVDGPPDEPQNQAHFDSLSDRNVPDISALDDGYSISSLTTPPRRRDEDRFEGIHEQPSFLHLTQDNYRTQRTRSFHSDRPIPAPRFRTHSDTTASRPQLMLQSDQLQGSAVEDGSSPVEPSPSSSFSSFPAHGVQDPYSPVPPWAAGDFLGLPNYGPHASEASPNGSPTPNFNWDHLPPSASDSEETGGSFYVDQYRPMSDPFQHPPMLPEWWTGDRLVVPSSATMYRNPASSFGGSETSSNASSPNPSWDHGSPLGASEPEDVGTSAQDSSPEGNSSNDTERPASRQGHELPDLAQQLQLQDGDNQTAGGYFRPGVGGFVYPSTSTDHQDHGPSHLGRPSTQQLPGIVTAGASEGFSAEGGISAWSGEPAEEKPLFRPVVGTEAGRNASANRRKDKTNPGPFVCDICGADFTAKHNLRNHQNSHNSVKDFKCETCEQAFTTKHVLKRHARKCNTKPY